MARGASVPVGSPVASPPWSVCSVARLDLSPGPASRSFSSFTQLRHSPSPVFRGATVDANFAKANLAMERQTGSVLRKDAADQFQEA